MASFGGVRAAARCAPSRDRRKHLLERVVGFDAAARSTAAGEVEAIVAAIPD
jgi:hypothetical protein